MKYLKATIVMRSVDVRTNVSEVQVIFKQELSKADLLQPHI